MRGTYLHFPTPLGPLLAAWSEQGVAYVGFHTQAEAGLAWCRAQWPRAQWQSHQGPAPDWLQRVAALQPGPCPVLDLSASTALQRAVWRVLQQVPWGQRCSYAELAACVQQPRAVRAVASAVARNRWAWLVPCHRVWRSNGAVGGFRWGVPLKHALCAHEQAQPAAGAA